MNYNGPMPDLSTPRKYRKLTCLVTSNKVYTEICEMCWIHISQKNVQIKNKKQECNLMHT